MQTPFTKVFSIKTLSPLTTSIRLRLLKSCIINKQFYSHNNHNSNNSRHLHLRQRLYRDSCAGSRVV